MSSIGAADSRAHYLRVSLGYGAFTLTDGALRMLVLLHLHAVGCSPLEIAGILAVYELLGVVTNLAAGGLGARLGLKPLISSGLALQALALGGLALLGEVPALTGLLITQGVSGVAKDLVKTGAKSSVKRLAPDGEGGPLLRWVAWLTGSKNALKGAGFFLGGALLAWVGFVGACWSLAGIVLAGACVALPSLPRLSSKQGRDARRAGVPSAQIRWLSAARMFLFASRDAWFAVALPLYLRAALGWSLESVGAFLAAWVVAYGFVQASAPRWLGGRSGGDARRLFACTAGLLAPLAALGLALALELAPSWTVPAGLALYGLVFALCSALHSYLIVAYSEEASVAQRVGFYYSANALGRLGGTLASGALFQWAGSGREGLLACLAGSAGCVLLAAALGLPLRRLESVR
ncbi:MAG: organoarsenical effux MFS transporter ArsJ [Planctomycetota bacterium]